MLGSSINRVWESSLQLLDHSKVSKKAPTSLKEVCGSKPALKDNDRAVSHLKEYPAS